MTSPSTAASSLPLLSAPVVKPKKSTLDATDTLPISTTGTSASAAFARSLFLFLGLMFRRPSKLFRPSRVDTWGGLRHLASQVNQTLSPTFIRTLIRSKSGALAMCLTILPPLVVNTTLGFLLFTSHSFFALSLARLPFFQHVHGPDTRESISFEEESDDRDQEDINLHTLLSGPTIIPLHPTLLSALSGAGAGLLQGLAFTPVENLVRLLQQSATGLTSLMVRVLRMPGPNIPTAEPIPSSPLQALRNFLSSERWNRSPSWWTGWRWSVGRDALSYSVFFAAFDMTRRAGLRVKALFGGPVSTHYKDFLAFAFSDGQITEHQDTPTIARVAQATTIVAGGITASLAAEMVGRPFRTCQRIMQNAKSNPTSSPPGYRPIVEAYRKRGWRQFVYSEQSLQSQLDLATQSRLHRSLKRMGWRMAAVGPWGFGFLVWAWVGGEV